MSKKTWEEWSKELAKRTGKCPGRIPSFGLPTDLLDKNKPQKIIQSNLRALCCCSAYAFHRTRNKIGLTTKFIKNL